MIPRDFKTRMAEHAATLETLPSTSDIDGNELVRNTAVAAARATMQALHSGAIQLRLDESDRTSRQRHAKLESWRMLELVSHGLGTNANHHDNSILTFWIKLVEYLASQHRDRIAGYGAGRIGVGARRLVKLDVEDDGILTWADSEGVIYFKSRIPDVSDSRTDVSGLSLWRYEPQDWRLRGRDYAKVCRLLAESTDHLDGNGFAVEKLAILRTKLRWLQLQIDGLVSALKVSIKKAEKSRPPTTKHFDLARTVTGKEANESTWPYILWRLSHQISWSQRAFDEAVHLFRIVRVHLFKLCDTPQAESAIQQTQDTLDGLVSTFEHLIERDGRLKSKVWADVVLVLSAEAQRLGMIGDHILGIEAHFADVHLGLSAESTLQSARESASTNGRNEEQTNLSNSTVRESNSTVVETRILNSDEGTDPIEQVLKLKQLALYQYLKSREFFVAFDTLRREDSLWRYPDPQDEAIARALKRLQLSLNEIGTGKVTLIIERSARRTKLDK